MSQVAISARIQERYFMVSTSFLTYYICFQEFFLFSCRVHPSAPTVSPSNLCRNFI